MVNVYYCSYSFYGFSDTPSRFDCLCGAGPFFCGFGSSINVATS